MKPGLKFLHSVFEVAHVEFQTYDIAHQHVLFSSGMVGQLLGYSDTEYAGLSKNFYESIVHPDDMEKVKQTIHRVIAAKSGDVIEMTARARNSSGEYMWLYSRQMIYQKGGKGNSFTIIREVEDVTRLIELQNSLGEKVEQLKAVSFRNSHLLRSPVANIIGLVNLIQENGITDEHNREIFHFLKDAIIKLDEVVHEINHMAKVE